MARVLTMQTDAPHDVPEAVVAVFRGLFTHYAGPVHRGLTAAQVPGWDSLSHAELIMALEDALGVRIDPAKAFDYPDLGALVDDLGGGQG